MIVGGGLEEIGWRGFLQSALQKRFSELFSTIIVSVIWAVGTGRYGLFRARIKLKGIL